MCKSSWIIMLWRASWLLCPHLSFRRSAGRVGWGAWEKPYFGFHLGSLRHARLPWSTKQAAPLGWVYTGIAASALSWAVWQRGKEDAIFHHRARSDANPFGIMSASIPPIVEGCDFRQYCGGGRSERWRDPQRLLPNLWPAAQGSRGQRV